MFVRCCTRPYCTYQLKALHHFSSYTALYTSHAPLVLQVERAKVLSNTVKQKRKEKAGKWEVPLPKVNMQCEDRHVLLQCHC